MTSGMPPTSGGGVFNNKKKRPPYLSQSKQSNSIISHQKQLRTHSFITASGGGSIKNGDHELYEADAG